MKRLAKYLKGYIKESVLGPLFKLAEATLELIVPLIIALIVDRGIENEDKSISVVKTLESMYVYDVLNQELESLTQLDERLAEAIVAEDTDYDFQPAYVVFRCTIMQAQTLIRLERMEAMHLTLQRTGE